MNRQTLDCFEKFSEAWLSCMIMMAIITLVKRFMPVENFEVD